MELGLIESAVIFGVEDTCRHNPFDVDLGKANIDPRIKVLGQPSSSSALGHQGALVDHTKASSCSKLRDMLGWHPRDGFPPVTEANRILLDFDLDCFIVRFWGGEYKFPWPDEVFEGEYSDDLRVKGFMDELINRAGLVTIAREPSHCGGDEKSDQVLHRLNQFIFDGKLSID